MKPRCCPQTVRAASAEVSWFGAAAIINFMGCNWFAVRTRRSASSALPLRDGQKCVALRELGKWRESCRQALCNTIEHLCKLHTLRWRRPGMGLHLAPGALRDHRLQSPRSPLTPCKIHVAHDKIIEVSHGVFVAIARSETLCPFIVQLLTNSAEVVDQFALRVVAGVQMYAPDQLSLCVCHALRR